MDSLHAVQLAAYAQMYKETTGKEISNGLIVRMDKKDNAKKAFELKKYSDLSKYFPVFKACLQVHRFLNPVKGAA